MKELDNLKRFSGHDNKHLIIALAAVKYQREWSFIFPKAEYDLSRRMESEPPPPSWDTMKWAAEQLSGLMTALNDIHNPPRLSVATEQRFGRHGDLKCDNILCFRSTQSSNETLVIADFGLSATHRAQSRSNIPNKTVPPVPGYRPPECDIRGGEISRAFDVWTMACLYLDFLTWLLGGPKLLLKFRQQRTTTYITGSRQDILFEFLKQHEHDRYVVQVKPQVRQWIRELRGLPECSQMVQDMLSIIESRMLVVLSEQRQRAQASELRIRFGNIYSSSCAKEEYCTKQGEIPKDVKVQDKPVVAELNDVAQDLIDKHRISLGKYAGRVSKPLSSQQQQRADL